MEYRQLGRSGLRVSALCLGTMNFGPRTSESESFEILDVATAHGINFIDTADQYGAALGVGTTERILGDWLTRNGALRDRLVLATKVHEPMSEDINDRGLSARHIQRACEASLKRLGVECIDLYQMHHIDRSVPIDEIWQAMDRLVAQGKVLYVGSSNFPGWAIARANERARVRGQPGLVSEQALYNLLERRTELEVLPACREYGLGLIPWSPLAGGLLAAPEAGASGRRTDADLQRRAETLAGPLGEFRALCESLGASMGTVALAWTLHQPGVASTIIGPGTAEQLRSALEVPHLELSEETLQALDAIFPPCGPAPEAYAW